VNRRLSGFFKIYRVGLNSGPRQEEIMAFELKSTLPPKAPPPGNSIGLVCGSELTLKDIQSIEKHGYSRWDPITVFRRIRDWYDHTNVEKAKKFLSIVMDEKRPLSVRVASFDSLEALAAEPFRRNFRRVPGADTVKLLILHDGVERKWRGGGCVAFPLTSEVMPQWEDKPDSSHILNVSVTPLEQGDLTSGFAQREITGFLRGLEKNAIDYVNEYTDKDFGRADYEIEGRCFNHTDENSEEHTRAAFGEFLHTECCSDFQRSAVAVLSSQYIIGACNEQVPIPPGRSHSNDQSQADGSHTDIQYTIRRLSGGDVVRVDVRYRQSNSAAYIEHLKTEAGEKPYARAKADLSFLIGTEPGEVVCIACDVRRSDSSHSDADEELAKMAWLAEYGGGGGN
jgi:hypothetical protein